MKKKKTHLNSPYTGYLFILPQFLFFAVFTIYPVFEGVRISLYKTTAVQNTFVGLNNYITLFQDSVFIRSVFNTLFLVVVVTVCMLLFGMLISVAIFDKNSKYIAVVRSCYYLPVIVSTVVMSMVWKFLLNPASVGQAIIMYVASMGGISGDILEAAEVDGASKFQRTIHIILPLTKPTTLYLSVTSVISMLKLFVIIQLLTDGGPNNSSMTMMYYLYRNAFSYDKKNIAAAVGVLMFILAVVMAIPQFRSMSGNGGKKR